MEINHLSLTWGYPPIERIAPLNELSIPSICLSWCPKCRCCRRPGPLGVASHAAAIEGMVVLKAYRMGPPRYVSWLKRTMK